MQAAAKKVRRIGPHSRPLALAKLDRRTKESRLLEQTVADLTAHVGGQPSAVQRMLIRWAAVLSFKLAQLDAEPALSEHDMRAYSAWQNHLRLTLRELGAKPPAEAPGAALQRHLANLREIAAERENAL